MKTNCINNSNAQLVLILQSNKDEKQNPKWNLNKKQEEMSLSILPRMLKIQPASYLIDSNDNKIVVH